MLMTSFLPPEILNIICKNLHINQLIILSRVSKGMYDSIFNDACQIKIKNLIKSFTYLKKYKKFVTNLQVRNNVYHKFDPIDFPRLTSLDISSCNLIDGDIDTLKDLPLKSLNVSGNFFKTLPAFSKVKKLIIRNCDIDVLPSMPNLEILQLKLFSTYKAVFGEYPNLQLIRIKNTYIDLSFLSKTRLKKLWMDVNNKIPDINTLEYIANYSSSKPHDYTRFSNLKHFEGNYAPLLPKSIVSLKFYHLFEGLEMEFPNLKLLFCHPSGFVIAPNLEQIEVTPSLMMKEECKNIIYKRYPNIKNIYFNNGERSKLPEVRFDRID